MAISHVKSLTVADATGTITQWFGSTTVTMAATDIARPADWNSVHNNFITLAGNTAGQATASGTNIVYAGGNNLTLSVAQGAGQATISFVGPSTAAGGVGLSAGSQSVNTGTVAFANSNGITFGMSGSSQITASYTVPSTAGLLSAVNVSAGTTSNNLSAVTFSNSNGLTFGLNGSVVTGSYTVPSTAGLLSAVNVSAGTTSNNLSAMVFSNGGNVSFGLNGSTITASAPSGGAGGIAAAAGTQTASSGTVVFSNSNNVSFGMSNTSVVTASVVVNASAGTTSNNLSAFVFSNSNNVSFGLNGSTITATATVAAQSNQTVGEYALGNTTGQSSSSTWDARSLSFAGQGIVSIGNSAGSGVVISATQSNQAASASNGSFAFQTLGFSNANNVTFGTSAGSIVTASVAAQTNPAASASNGSFSFQTLGFSNANNVTFGTSAGSIVTASVAAQSNQTLGLYAISNTTGQSSSSTFDARSLSFEAAGIASIGYSNGSVVISVPAGGGSGDGVNIIAAGTQTANTTGTVLFSNANGVTFGMNNSSVVTASVNAGGGGGATLSSWQPIWPMGLSTIVVATATSTQGTLVVYPFQLPQYVSAGILNIPVSMNFSTAGTSSGQQTVGLRFAIFTQGTSDSASILSQIWSNSLSIGLTANNSTYTLNHPVSTDYGGYTTGSTTSAGVNISSQYTGAKIIGIPVSSMFSPGQYWLGMLSTFSTSSIANVGLLMSMFGAVVPANMEQMAPIGNLSANYSTGNDPSGRFMIGHGIWNSAGSNTAIPSTIAFASISTNALASVMPYMQFWST